VKSGVKAPAAGVSSLRRRTLLELLLQVTAGAGGP